MSEKRFLSEARLKSEGDPTVFDEGAPVYDGLPIKGRGQTMREQDLLNVWLIDDQQRWYVVRDNMCSSDIDDENAAVWTLSRTPGEPGWSTDSGSDGYGLLYADARELADAANVKMTRRPGPSSE